MPGAAAIAEALKHNTSLTDGWGESMIRSPCSAPFALVCAFPFYPRAVPRPGSLSIPFHPFSLAFKCKTISVSPCRSPS